MSFYYKNYLIVIDEEDHWEAVQSDGLLAILSLKEAEAIEQAVIDYLSKEKSAG